MKGLEGKRIGVAATRQAEAISILIQKNGGMPFVFSIQGEQQVNEQMSAQNVRDLIDQSFDRVLLTTGIGIETLEKAALQLNLHSEFIHKVKNTSLAVRGRKTHSWTKKHSLPVEFVSEDGTMDNLLLSMDNKEEKYGKRIFLQAYNQDDEILQLELQKQGYDVYLSKPYHFIEPSLSTIRNLKQEILNQTLDAVIFTSKTQVQNLFVDSTSTDAVVNAFNKEVLAVAVGKVTANELEKQGITYVFQPSIQKMGVMIVELREYFLEQRVRLREPLH